MLGHNPGGREDPDKAGREEGYLFWLAWVTHQGANLQSIDDANGPMRPIFLTGTCKTLTSLVNDQPQLEFALGLSPLLATVCENPDTTLARASRRRSPALGAREGRADEHDVARRPAASLVIAGFALSCFGLLLFLWLAFGGPIPLKPQGYRVQVAFTDAATLADQADVRVAGVTIGKVVEKELAPGGQPPLDDDRAREPLRAAALRRARDPAPEDAARRDVRRARRRARAGAPALPEGARLADGQVAQAVEFDELLQIFDEPTRKAFQRVAGERRARRAPGAGATSTTRSATCRCSPRTRRTSSTCSTRAAPRCATSSATPAGRSSRSRATRSALATLVQRNAELFGELAERRDALAESIRILPTFLDETKATLARRADVLASTPSRCCATSTRCSTTCSRRSSRCASCRPTSRTSSTTSTRSSTRATRACRRCRACCAAWTRRSPRPARSCSQLNPLLRFLEFNQAKLSDFIADRRRRRSAASARRRRAARATGTSLPQIIIAGAQTLPALDAQRRQPRQRLPRRRTRARDPDAQILPSFDCSNGGEKPPTNTPGCKVQGRSRSADLEPVLPAGARGRARAAVARAAERACASASSATSSGSSSRACRACRGRARSSTRGDVLRARRRRRGRGRAAAPARGLGACSSPRSATAPTPSGRRAALRDATA